MLGTCHPQALLPSDLGPCLYYMKKPKKPESKQCEVVTVISGVMSARKKIVGTVVGVDRTCLAQGRSQAQGHIRHR